MAEDWASKIRESIDRSNKAMDLYKRQTQAGMMNAQSGGTTRFTATDDGRIIDPGVFTANTTGISGDRFSGGPIESASFYGSGQINEVGGASTPEGQPRPRTRGPAAPRQSRHRQRRGSYMPPNQQTPRQRFTA